MDEYKVIEDKVDKKRILFGYFFAFDSNLQAAGDAYCDGITFKQFILLTILFISDKAEPTIGKLSELMGCSHQNVKQIVNKLKIKGYVNTYSDRDDRRKLRVMSTKKAEKLRMKYKDKEIVFLDKFYEGVSNDEIDVAINIISKIENNLRAIREEYNKNR